MLNGIDKNSIMLYVSGCKEIYEGAIGWKDFLHIEELPFGTIFFPMLVLPMIVARRMKLICFCLFT